MLTTDVENYPGFADGIIGPELMDQMEKQAQRFGAEILSVHVTEVDLSTRPFVVKAGDLTWRARTLIVSTGAVRLENTTDFYVHPGYPAIAHRDVVWALEAACIEVGAAYHVGLTATASGFYAPQGRAMRTLPVRYPDLAEELRRQGVANLEMESSALFVLAGLSGLRAGTVCTCYAQRVDGTFLEGAAKEAAEARCIDVGLAGIHLLWAIDNGDEGDPHARWSRLIGDRGGER